MRPLLTREHGMFCFRCDFEDNYLAKAARLRWFPEYKCWGTDSVDKANMLIKWADDSTRAMLKQETPPQLILRAPEGLEYYNFQKEAINFVNQKDASLLALDMGLGKTICVIGYINAVPTVNKVLVICPASLKVNWKREMEKWLVRNLSISVINGKKWQDADVVIINYDILHNHREALRATEWDLRVVDECTYLKSGNKTRRGREVLGKWDGRKKAWVIPPIPARKRVFLSGTPMLNRPVELWPLLRATDPKRWTNYYNFVYRYCNAYRTQWGLDVSGASNTRELGDILRATIMFRKTKEEALPELPSKIRQVIELPSNGNKKLIEDEWKLFNEVIKNNKDIDKAKNEEEYIKAVQNLRDSQSVLFQQMSRIRRLTALAKLPQVIEYIHNVLEQEDKIVVFAHHVEVIEALHKEFPDSVVLYGKTTDKQKPVDEFMNNPKCRLFIGNIKSAGVGITLTVSNFVIFAELDWTPANVTQAEDRCARIGQKNTVIVQHLVFEDSIDCKIAKTIIRKQQIINSVMEGSTKAVDMIKEGALEHEEKEDVDRPLIDDKLKSLTLQALRSLAIRCDGARDKDDVGFNKVDSAFGKKLAANKVLSGAQVLIALTMLQKYKRQLLSISSDFRELFPQTEVTQ